MLNQGTLHDARLNFRLPADMKSAIEQAAAHLGQSVSDFAVSTLVRTARDVLEQERVTRLSNADRDALFAILDKADLRPNAALRNAAKRYKKRRG
jgi:uncharacterized protein (DUF1778 family)